MKNLTLSFVAAFLLMTLTSCSVVETAFDAGMYWAFFLVAAVIAVVIWLLTKNRGN